MPPTGAMPPSNAMPASGAMPASSAGATVRSVPPDSIASDYKIDFDALDKNHDGNLSRGEVQASGNADLQREFRAVDNNHNGRLSKDEMKGWMN